MKKIILAAMLLGCASLGFAQKRKATSYSSDVLILNEANLQTPIKAQGKKAKAKMKVAAKNVLQGEYKLADGNTMKWFLMYDKSTRTVSSLGLDHSAQSSGTFVSQPLPANFWEKASETFIKNDEANQKLSIQALLQQVYK